MNIGRSGLKQHWLSSSLCGQELGSSLAGWFWLMRLWSRYWLDCSLLRAWLQEGMLTGLLSGGLSSVPGGLLQRSAWVFSWHGGWLCKREKSHSVISAISYGWVICVTPTQYEGANAWRWGHWGTDTTRDHAWCQPERVQKTCNSLKVRTASSTG